MSLSMYSSSVPVFVHYLKSLSTILRKGADYAADKKIDEKVLTGARLFPDMFPLTRQVQIACDFAKGVSARLAQADMPNFEDTETTLAEYKARIANTIAFIQTLSPDAFAGAETRQIVIMRKDTKREYSGLDYAHHAGLPNFYFHVTTAYNILRHNGVLIGKKDFIGSV